MTIITALDQIFSFIPKLELERFKKEGLYQPILSGQAKNASDFYDHLNRAQCQWPRINYYYLAKPMKTWLLPGLTLQIGSGNGELLFQLYQQGQKLLYGLDCSPAMIRLARQRIKPFSIRLIKDKAENIKNIKLLPLKNIIIHNFWGLMPKSSSIKLLLELKNKLLPHGQIIIGPVTKSIPTNLRLAAEKILSQELGFNFSYPQFHHFSQLGYHSQIIKISGLNYYLLKKP